MNLDIEQDIIEEEKEFNKICKKYKYQPSILPSVDRIIVIGDIHGDMQLALDSLKLANLIEIIEHEENKIPKVKWIGGKTIVVQIGDQIDSCRPHQYPCTDKRSLLDDKPDDINVINFFTELNNLADKDGGAVYSLLGNHEIMNIEGNFNYVSYNNLDKFSDYVDPKDPTKKFESKLEARKHAFSIGNDVAVEFACTRHSAVVIGSFIFVHAGIVPDFIRKSSVKNRSDLVKMNLNVRKWLLGLINKNNVKHIVGSLNYSIFWNRVLGSIPSNMNSQDNKCITHLKDTLELFKVKSMIIGHTPQFYSNNEGINGTCNDGNLNQLWRVDIGGSCAFHTFDEQYMRTGKITDLRQAQVLEILEKENKINVLK